MSIYFAEHHNIPCRTAWPDKLSSRSTQSDQQGQQDDDMLGVVQLFSITQQRVTSLVHKQIAGLPESAQSIYRGMLQVHRLNKLRADLCDNPTLMWARGWI